MQRTRAISTATALLAVLIACGWSHGAQERPAFSKTVHQPVMIDAFGDSTQAGLTVVNGSYFMTPHNEPMTLQWHLRAQFGAGVTVWNQGVGATTLAWLITGKDSGHTMPFQQLMEKSAAHIVIQNFGINDAGYDTTAQFMANVDRFVTSVRANGKIPVLEEPNPVCENPSAPKNIAQIDAYVVALEDYATRYNIALVRQYAYIKSLPNWQSLLPDCIHPSEQLYAIKAERLAAAVAPIVASLNH